MKLKENYKFPNPNGLPKAYTNNRLVSSITNQDVKKVKCYTFKIKYQDT